MSGAHVAAHVVVDGSNIATEGRAAPSLQQLDEGVRALIGEYGYSHVTVVVDATFGHRIDAKERASYEEAVLNGELVTPPAGAIGRGDAFVLQIADRAGADVFSNDSFQEFHGQYPWLFDEGRLIGGKPVPNVGWIFVLRAPVRGPASRRSVRDSKRTPKKAASRPSTKSTSKPATTKPTTKPTSKPATTKPASSKPATTKPAAAKAKKASAKASAAVAPAPKASLAAGPRSRTNTKGSGAKEAVNPQLTYAHFVVEHPIGSQVEGTVERFSSHGAYVDASGARCYVALRDLGNPPPRSAREVLNLGETRAFTVQRFDPARRGIDVVPVDAQVLRQGSATRRRQSTPAKASHGSNAAEAVATATGITNQTDAEEAPVSPAAKKATRKRSAKKAPAKRKAAARKAPAKRKAAAKKSPAKKRATKKRAPAKRKAAAKRSPAKKRATKKRAPAKRKAAAKRSPAKKRATKKRATRKKAAAKKAPAKRRATKKRAPAKRKAAAKRKAPAKRRAAKKR